ncbi:hypothetical protein [Nonomuraea sp. NPDC005501]|uniref:hypothetical protein n=1 Tax=Nonomuraea sp. NPDC005501 TaxID=3156884 RepID=UPI00339E6EB0
MYRLLSAGERITPPVSWMLAAALAILRATAALAALPTRVAARRSVAQTLSAETA